MKKPVFQIVVAVILLLMGCSKDEIIYDKSEDNQLKRGSTNGVGTLISFIGNSIEGEYFSLDELKDGSIIPKKGKCSGSVFGYGKINSSLSSYSFVNCNGERNPEYDYVYPPPQINRACTHMYKMNGSAKINITATDYFIITITGASLVPYNYEPSFFGTETTFKGALFLCPNGTQGNAYINLAKGKCSTLEGRTVQIYNNGSGYVINREKGVMSLSFRIK